MPPLALSTRAEDQNTQLHCYRSFTGCASRSESSSVFQLCVLAYHCVHGAAPAYLSDTCGRHQRSSLVAVSALLTPRHYKCRRLRCIRSYLDFKTASTIATSIVHSKLDYCNSLYHNLPNSNRFKTLLLVLLLRLLDPLISLPFSNLSTG